MDTFIGLLVWALIILLYWMPTVVAVLRGHRQVGSILIINCFLGWTFIGWAVALAMALSAQPPRGRPMSPGSTVMVLPYGEGAPGQHDVSWGSGYPSARPPHQSVGPEDPNSPALRERPIP